MAVVTDYTALLSGSYWNGIEVTGRPVIVTYSFPTSLPSYDASIGGFTPSTLTSFQAFNGLAQAQVEAALNEWAAASGLIFVRVAPGDGDLNFQGIDFDTTSGPSYSGAGGIGFYPFGNWDFFSYPYFNDDLDSSGEVFMNTQFRNPDGTYSYGTLLHEIGHAIGLKHPTEVVTDFAANPDVVHDQVLSSDDPSRTIMATVGDSGATGTPHLQQLDKDAAAFIYGAAGTGDVLTATAAGVNSVSSWSWDATTQVLIQTAIAVGADIRGSSVTDIIIGSSGNDRLFGLAGDDDLTGNAGNDTLYGGSGVDTMTGGIGDDVYLVSNSAAVLVEDPGGGFDSVYAGVDFTLPDNIESLSLFGSGLTGTGNDGGVSLFGDGVSATRLNGGAGDDYMVGGAGNDTFAGGGGADLVYGMAGANTFVYTAVGDAPTGGTLDTIADFVEASNVLDLSAIKTTGASPGADLTFVGTDAFSNKAGEVHQRTSGADTIVEGDTDGNGTADFQILLTGSHTLSAANVIVCYRAGTRIRTPLGEVAVEHLAIGDRVVTAAGSAEPITWIGHRHVDCTRHPDHRLVWPVRVRAGAFGPEAPHRDLFLSPDHAVFVDGALVPIRHLINGATIAQVAVDHVTYFHVELARHAVLFAEGLAAESYLDTGNRGSFANAAGPVALHPAFGRAKSWDSDAAAPLMNDEARLRPLWHRLARRALLAGFALPDHRFTSDPDPWLEADGQPVRPLSRTATTVTFALPPRPGRLRLRSRASHATDARPWIDDRRRLGVYVSRLSWSGADMAVDHPALSDGWWDVEHAGARPRRWTNGDAALPAVAGASTLTVHLAGSIAYLLDPAPPVRVTAA